MRKYDFPEFLSLYKNYFAQFKHFTPLTPILCILSFFFLLALECLLLAEKFCVAFFEFFPSNNDDHVAYRITMVLAFSWLYMFKYILMGFVNSFIFLFGFFYDKTNAMSTFCKGPSAFINW